MPKNKPNGFMSFVMEWKSKSGRNMSVPEAVKHCGQIWEKMNKEERDRYLGKAKSSARSFKPQEKLDCLGRPISQVQKEREEAEQKERTMKRNIEESVKETVRNYKFESQKYYFVMVNYFLKTREGLYVPAELAIAQFSLKDGVHRKYHSLISPGVDIFGYQYEAQTHANETHMLPLPPKALGERNWATIYKQFINFIRDPETGKLPPVYTHRDHMAAVSSVINFLQCESTTVDNIEVYSIQHLFFVMKERCAEIGELEKPSSIFVTDAQFDRDFFEYQIGIACQFHEEKDRSKYCALSYVVRWGYMFGDYMCDDIAIVLKPGYHIPLNTKLNAITIEPEEDKKSKESSAMDKEPAVDVFWEQRWANETQAITNDKTFSEDFPSLSARKKTSSAAAIKRENLQINDDFDDYQLDASNPWSRSQRKKPQEPDTTYYSINFNSTRTNQTFLPDDDDDGISTCSATKPRKPVGRGRIF